MDVVAVELIRQLQKLDTENNYTLFAKDGPDRKCVQQSPRFKTEILKGFGYPGWEQFSLPAALRKHKPDIVHCTGNTAPLSSPTPLVLTLHDIIYLETTSFGGSAYQDFGNLYRKWIVPKVIRRAKKIITVSEFEKEIIIRKCGIDKATIDVIYNGVSEKFTTAHPAEIKKSFRSRYLLPEEFILVLGNAAPKKNTQGMIMAYLHYHDITKDPLPLVIADYKKSMVEKILHGQNRSDLIGQFMFPGYISSEEMPLLYSCASLFVYPSLRESFGLPILEAMASGVPVLTSNTSAMPEIAGDAAMFADPDNHKDIAEKMHTILFDTAIMHAYKQKGPARAGQFSWENSAKQLIQLYNHL